MSLAGCEPDCLLATADTPTQTLLMLGHLRVVSLLADLYDRELVSTIGWAKQVPGFTDLTLNDQMKLLQTTWTEVNQNGVHHGIFRNILLFLFFLFIEESFSDVFLQFSVSYKTKLI